MNEILDRLRAEIDAQDGTDISAEALSAKEWGKIETSGENFGSPVTIVFRKEAGCEEMEPITDHGYLTCLPDRDGDWEDVGIVHIPRPWVEKESPVPEWHSLYSLCKNPSVEKILIGKSRTPRAF